MPVIQDTTSERRGGSAVEPAAIVASQPSFCFSKPVRVASEKIGRRSPVRMQSLRFLPHPPPVPAPPPPPAPAPAPAVEEAHPPGDLFVTVQSLTFPSASPTASGQFSCHTTSNPPSSSNRSMAAPSFQFYHSPAESEAIERLRREFDALAVSMLSDGSMRFQDMPQGTLVSVCQQLQKMIQEAVKVAPGPPSLSSGLQSRVPSFSGKAVALQQESPLGVSHTGSMTSVTSFRPTVRSTGEILKTIDDETGQKKINQFVVLNELGRGSQAKVKLVFDCHTSELRAMKVIRRPQSLADCKKSPNSPLGGDRSGVYGMAPGRLEHEVKIWRSLRHRNVVRLHEVIDDPQASKLYLVMEYINGGPITKPRGMFCDRIDLNACGELSRQLTAGLSYLHHHNVVHRDIKPDNCMVDVLGFVHLVDFGVSEMFEADTGIPGMVRGMQGTPAYMPPEMLVVQSQRCSLMTSVMSGCETPIGPSLGLTSPDVPNLSGTQQRPSVMIDGFAADVWSLGVTLFSCLVGRLPFVVHGDASAPPSERFAFFTAQYYRAVVEDSPQFPPHPVLAQCRALTKEHHNFEEPLEPLDEGWAALLRSMLHKDPAQRPTIRDVHRRVKTCAAASAVKRSASGRRLLTGWGKRRSPMEIAVPSADGMTAVRSREGALEDEMGIGYVVSYQSSRHASPMASMTHYPAEMTVPPGTPTAAPTKRRTTLPRDEEHPVSVQGMTSGSFESPGLKTSSSTLDNSFLRSPMDA